MDKSNDCMIEMPKYKCDKEVHALQISDIVHDNVLAGLENRDTDGSAMLVPVDDRYAAFKVSADFLKKHEPANDGYFVVYKGGYKSFSPKDAFEQGYKII